MNRTRARTGAFFATLIVFTCVVLWWSPRAQETAADEQPKALPAGQPVAMPAGLTGVLITLGLKDEKATDWNGEVSVSAGKVLRVDIVQGNPKATVEGNKFTVRSIFPRKRKKRKPGTSFIPWCGSRSTRRRRPASR